MTKRKPEHEKVRLSPAFHLREEPQRLTLEAYDLGMRTYEDILDYIYEKMGERKSVSVCFNLLAALRKKGLAQEKMGYRNVYKKRFPAVKEEAYKVPEDQSEKLDKIKAGLGKRLFHSERYGYVLDGKPIRIQDLALMAFEEEPFARGL